MANPISERMAAKRVGLKDAAAEQSPTKLQRLPFYQQALVDDQKRMKMLPSLEEKVTAKVSALETYMPFINDYLESGHNYMNNVAVQVLIWLFDILAIEPALKLGLVLVEQKQVMPGNFGRNLPTFICDALYDWASDLLKQKQSASPYLDQLIEKLPAWTVDYDLHPAVVSKCYVMLAKHKNQDGDFKAAVALCDQAIAANPEGHGCKTLRENAAKAIAA